MDKIPSRPTTPHRRSNSAASNCSNHYAVDPVSLPLDQVLGSQTRALEELSDGMATLDTNLQHLQLVHESLAGFTESFSAFLHGIKMNAWCVEFSEAPEAEHFKRDRSADVEQQQQKQQQQQEQEEEEEVNKENDETYMTDTHSFIAQPTTILKNSRVSGINGGGGGGIPRPKSRINGSNRNTVSNNKRSQSRIPSGGSINGRNTSRQVSGTKRPATSMR